MLVRWMHDADDERQGYGDGDVAAGVAERPAAEPPRREEAAGPKAPLTDDERCERVLRRCSGEGLAVSRDEVKEALETEGGHVGKTMIRLRRRCKEVAAEAAVGHRLVSIEENLSSLETRSTNGGG